MPSSFKFSDLTEISRMSEILTFDADYLASQFNIDFKTQPLAGVCKELALHDHEAIWVCGGAVVRTLTGENLFKGDIDIYCTTDKALDKIVGEFKDDKTFVKTEHAFSFNRKIGIKDIKVQIITKNKPTSLGTTLDGFDLEHCKFAYSPKYKSIVSDPPACISLARKELRLNYVEDPAYTLGRVMKYKHLGYNADRAIERLTLMILKNEKNINFGGTAVIDCLEELVTSTCS